VERPADTELLRRASRGDGEAYEEAMSLPFTLERLAGQLREATGARRAEVPAVGVCR
jgi:hypothetical protein